MKTITMKKSLFLMLFLAIAGTSFAKKDRNLNNPIIGTWKFSNQSFKNDLQQIKSKANLDYQTEYFVFDNDNKFRHEFMNADGKTVKTLHGKWKSIDDKVKIVYSEIDFSLNVPYFFIDKDLVLGQNFNHVIFSKYNNAEDQNVALK